MSPLWQHLRTRSASSSCSPSLLLRWCPSLRSFTTWRTETLIMYTWPLLFCSSSPRTMPSIAPSTRWWVDTNTHSWHFRELPLQPSITCTGLDNHSWWFYASFLSLSLSQVLKNISWYTERSLTEISLGSLLILVVIRTIQFNMTRTRVRSCSPVHQLWTLLFSHRWRLMIDSCKFACAPSPG